MTMLVAKEKLIFDPTDPTQTDNLGAYVRAGTDGDLISSSNITNRTIATERLDVNLQSEYFEDTPHISGDRGSFVMAVRHDDDSTGLVDADGDYSPLLVDSQGRLKVSASVDVDSDYVYAEDSPHTNADLGAFTLLVRQDTLAASTSADGDYGAFKSNSRGGLWTVPVGTVADGVADNENPVKIGSRAVVGPLAALATGQRADAISDLYRRLYVNNGANIAIKSGAANVTDTAAAIITTGSSLAGRRNYMIQNLSNKEIFIGSAAVTTANGWRIASGAAFGLELGPDVAIFAVAASAGPFAIRVLEVA